MLNNSMLKINSSKTITKKCVCCDSLIDIKIYANPKHPEYLLPTAGYKSRISCSRECHKTWQKTVSWEDRIGKDRAEEIRKIRSQSAKTDNPSTRPGVAEKISNSTKQFLSEHPGVRSGKNNGFHGKSHTEERKEQWRNDKKGKWSYNPEQKEKQTLNTPKKENHHAWQGGISNGEYGIEFSKELKENVKTKYKNTCQLCKSTNVDLDIHHIDYNKTNNTKNNLIPLCKACHGTTNFGRDEWQKILTEIKKSNILNDK